MKVGALLTTGAAVLATLLTTALPASGAPPTDEFAEVDSHLSRQLAALRAPGSAVAIVRGDQVAYQRTWGVDGDEQPVTGQTPFLLGSVAKPFTALAVMQLVEAGQVELDTPILRYLPWFRLADAAAAEKITVRQLLTHTSGLPGIESSGLTDRGDNTPDGLTRSVQDLTRLRPTATPGQTYQYSGANYQVLGALVEAVTGQPFGAYLRRNVLDPLDMRHTATTSAEAAAIGLTAGHRYHFGRPQRFDLPYDTSGVPYGYLAASLEDLTHFATTQLTGGRYGDSQLLSASGIAQSHTGQVAVGNRGRYGLGWRDTVLTCTCTCTGTGTGTRIVWHAGAVPNSFSHVVLVPESELAIVVLSNVYSLAMDPPLTGIAFDVARILHGGTVTTAEPDPLLTGALVTMVTIASLLLAGLVWTLVRAIRRRRSADQPGGAPTRGRLLATTVGSLVGCAALAIGAVWGLPAASGAGPAQVLLWAPDLGQASVAVAVLATALAVVRTVRTVRTGHSLADIRRASSSTLPPAQS
ncbi:serine hydrolase domain-containing protein [Micromonospora sp. NPDC003197]